jgi:hypothetical protein
MSPAAAGNETSHPVEVECPFCSHRLRVSLRSLSAGVELPCHGCNSVIPIATCTLRQLLREIDKDLRTPDDLTIVLRPPICRPAPEGDAGEDGAKPS